MELKQKKTIYWSVILTLLISISIFFLITDESGLKKEEGVWMGISFSILQTLILLYLPSLIIWRIMIGKIDYRIRNIESLRFVIYIFQIIILVSFIMMYFKGFFIKVSDFLSEYSREITAIFTLLGLSFLLHIVLKTFIFNIIKGEKQTH